MTRSEYLTKIATLLQDISVEERKEAMKFYNDYFDEAGDDNADQAIKDLGSPEEVASKIRESLASGDFVKPEPPKYTTPNVAFTPVETATPAKKNSFPGWAIALIIVGVVLLMLVPFIFGIATFSRAARVVMGSSHSVVDYNGPAQSGSYEAADVESINIEIDAGNFDIVVDNGSNSVWMGYNNVTIGDITEDFDGDTFRFKYKVTGNISGFGKSGQGPSFTLYVPSGFSCEDITIAMGAGDVDFSGDLKCTDKIDISIGAGNLEIDGWNINDLNLKCGCGNFEFKGTLTGDMEADLGAGNMSLYLTGSESDHNYDVEKAVGNFTINGHSFMGIAGDHEIDNDSDSTIEVKCAMGNVEIFTDK